MSYKDLLVVLDSDAASRGRIDLAAVLAERCAAHLVGLYSLPVPEMPRHLGYFDRQCSIRFFRICASRRKRRPTGSAKRSSTPRRAKKRQMLLGQDVSRGNMVNNV